MTGPKTIDGLLRRLDRLVRWKDQAVEDWRKDALNPELARVVIRLNVLALATLRQIRGHSEWN